MEVDIKNTGYQITDDHTILNKENALTPELQEILPKYHELAVKGKKSGVEIMMRAIKKYPNNPNLKNYLSVLYSNMGKDHKASEVTRKIVKEHPDYLFGKINLAFDFHAKGDYEKMPKILGKKMDLKALYPHRDTFHISEALTFYRCALLYYISMDNLEEAEIRYRLIEQAAPDSDDERFAFRLLTTARMKVGAQKWKEADEKRIHVITCEQPVTQKITPPDFIHPEMELLYQNGLRIEEEILRNILALPRKTLISDLEKVLQDSIERYTFFCDKFEVEDWAEGTSDFVIHAIFLLGELKAEESMDSIFSVLSQSEDYHDTYFGEFLTEILWEPLYKIVKNRLNDCLPFMCLPGIYTNSKSLFPTITELVLRREPQRRKEIIEWYREVIAFFLRCKREDNIIDSVLMGFLVCSIMDADAGELLPDIKELYANELVSLDICGTYDEVAQKFENADRRHSRKNILSIAERYKQVTETWAGYNEEKNNKSGLDYGDKDSIPNIKETKIGRNEPCPCGSGKKYKKCCLNK